MRVGKIRWKSDEHKKAEKSGNAEPYVAIKMKACARGRGGGRGGDTCDHGLFQKVAEGTTSYGLSWKVKVMIPENVKKTEGFVEDSGGGRGGAVFMVFAHGFCALRHYCDSWWWHIVRSFVVRGLQRGWRGRGWGRGGGPFHVALCMTLGVAVQHRRSLW